MCRAGRKQVLAKTSEGEKSLHPTEACRADHSTIVAQKKAFQTNPTNNGYEHATQAILLGQC